ncbi:MAG: class I SAM-dependent methyltransferase [Polyangiales bacterium]
MTTATPTTSAATPNFTEIKTRQQAMWASGDYAVVGTTLQIVGETLVDAADLHAGQRVLDVACGNGNAALAAARRFAEVTGIDYVPSLLARAEARARADGVSLRVVEGDAEAMPFESGSFDLVLSTFGVMFAPNHVAAARELARVTAPGGKIGLASWTPDGFIGQLFRIIGKYVPPAPGVSSPILWGTEAHLATLFEGRARVIHAERKTFDFRYLSAAHFVDVFRTYYGPTHKAFGALDPRGQAALAQDMTELMAKYNRPGATALAVPSEYLEVVLKTEG